MTEQTNPDAGVSVDDAVSQLMAMEEQPEGQAQTPQGGEESSSVEQQQPESQAESEAPEQASEGEQETEQPAVEQTYKIVHNGQEIPLTLAQLIENAQQGYDGTRKYQALAEKNRQVDERFQHLTRAEQLSPYVQQQRAVVQSIAAQLQPYQQLDWVAYYQQNGAEAYGVAQAQYMNLQRTYQQAAGQLQQTEGEFKANLQAFNQKRLAEESARLPSLVPEWSDPNKLDAARGDIANYYANKYGVDPRELDAKTDSALAMAVLWKAKRYDELQASKSDKSKTLRQAPPVTVPGSRATSSAQANKLQEAEKRLRKSGSMEDAVAVLLNRQGKGSS